ncbi:MAG: class I SAM-dependent methyltransferase [Congregibacter sp.]
MHTQPRLANLGLAAALPLLLSSFLFSSFSVAQDGMDERTSGKLKAAMAAKDRPEGDRKRDRNRKPLETLEFFGFSDDMKVLEISPGGGWYTRFLMPTLADRGKLYLTLGASRVSNLSGVPGYKKAEVLEGANFGERQPDGRFNVDAFSLGMDDLDLALTFRNMHNFSESGRANINKAVFEGLKSGGHYGVVDHTRRHMQPDSSEVGRRIDPVLIIKEVESAGFDFVGYSDLHYKPDDELRYEVGRASVTGNTDRFTLLFRKP